MSSRECRSYSLLRQQLLGFAQGFHSLERQHLKIPQGSSTHLYSDPPIDRNGFQYIVVGIYFSVYLGVYIRSPGVLQVVLNILDHMEESRHFMTESKSFSHPQTLHGTAIFVYIDPQVNHPK